MDDPSRDLDARSAIWDQMQMFWMDTDPGLLVDSIADTCASSKFSLDELEHIYWNEVRPAVSFNLAMLPAPEWCGFEKSWLVARVLKKHRFGRPLPWKFLHPYSRRWWLRLRSAICERRADVS
jgi:hypothetical protein